MVPRMSPSGIVGHFVIPFVILTFAACGDTSDPTSPDASRSVGTDPSAGSQGQGSNKGRFIVTLQERESPAAVAAAHGLTPEFTYTHVLNGFAGEISEAARSGLLRDLRVVRVERDVEVSTQDLPQWGAPWGLDRIDQRTTALDGLYSYDATGAGVTVYILDTGIRYTHREFEGRASFGFDAYGGDGSDCYGHGTHVAGTVGGATFGVAKDVQLVSVKVLGCNGLGTISRIVAGMDWVAANHTAPAVANMSLIASAVSPSLDQAVARLTQAGVTTVVAAGNYGADACDFSPARAKEAITVGATGPTDTRSSFSNWGRCVDWFAPGEGVVSASYGSDTDIAVKSGTSMATPHTAGVAALYLESAGASTPVQVADELLRWTTKDAVIDSESRNDHLLYSRGPGDGEPPPNQAPESRFSFTCEQLACQFTDESSDSDGSVTAWSWDFGTGESSADQNPGYTFPAPGIYKVTLTVTDDQGVSGSRFQYVMLADPSGAIQLTAVAYKVKGRHHVELTWSGASGDFVDLYRDGVHVASPENTGNFTDVPDGKGRGAYRYQLCESGSITCSPELDVVY